MNEANENISDILLTFWGGTRNLALSFVAASEMREPVELSDSQCLWEEKPNQFLSRSPITDIKIIHFWETLWSGSYLCTRLIFQDFAWSKQQWFSQGFCDNIHQYCWLESQDLIPQGYCIIWYRHWLFMMIWQDP